MSFKFPLLLNELFDNISCEGQIICVPIAKYSSIMILGCSFWGDLCEKMQIEYLDGHIEDVNLAFSELYDYHGFPPSFNETIIWKGRCFSYEDNGIDIKPYNARLYAIKACLKYNGEIKRLILPNLSYLHIFCISLSPTYGKVAV